MSRTRARASRSSSRRSSRNHAKAVPLIRRAGVAKDPEALQALNRDSADWSAVFREASWDEALALVGLTQL